MTYNHLKVSIDNSPSTFKDYLVSYNTDVINENFMKSISYEEVYFNDLKQLQGVQIMSTGTNSFDKKIVMPPNINLNIGDVITRLGKFDSKWLCTTTDQNEIYIKGKIEKCNIDLKWIDKDGNLFIYPAVLDDGDVSNTGIDVDIQMRLPAGRRLIRLRKDENSIKIKRDDRFIFGGEAFLVTDRDYVSTNGLMVLALESNQFDLSDDNIELEIANYYSKINKINFEIISGNNMLMNIGKNYNIILKISDKNGIVNNPIVSYEYDNNLINIDLQGIVTPIKSGNGRIKITYKNKFEFINFTVAQIQSVNYTCLINGNNNINTGSTSNYSVEFFNDGIKTNQNSFFTILDKNNNTVNYAIITEQDNINNTCKIKVSNKMEDLNKVFILYVKDNTGLYTNSKEIKIKSLF